MLPRHSCLREGRPPRLRATARTPPLWRWCARRGRGRVQWQHPAHHTAPPGDAHHPGRLCLQGPSYASRLPAPGAAGPTLPCRITEGGFPTLPCRITRDCAALPCGLPRPPLLPPRRRRPRWTTRTWCCSCTCSATRASTAVIKTVRLPPKAKRPVQHYYDLGLISKLLPTLK